MFIIGGVIFLSCLLISLIGWTCYFIIKKGTKSLTYIIICCMILFASGFVISIKKKLSKPILLNKENIAGTYRIDTNFYPGKNALWQYNHYSFRILPNDSIYFYITNESVQLKTINSKIKFIDGPPWLWSIQPGNDFHIIRYNPVLYRGHSRFYYVFQSSLYGNMFFRKQ